jgi:hypothetical protein
MADESTPNDVRGAGATGNSGLTRRGVLRGGLVWAAPSASLRLDCRRSHRLQAIQLCRRIV